MINQNNDFFWAKTQKREQSNVFPHSKLDMESEHSIFRLITGLKDRVALAAGRTG